MQKEFLTRLSIFTVNNINQFQLGLIIYYIFLKEYGKSSDNNFLIDNNI
jgi:hypothetical protein